MDPRGRIRHSLDTCRRGPLLIKLMSYEHREDAVGGAGKGKHIHTHMPSVPRDTQDGWSLCKDRTQN